MGHLWGEAALLGAFGPMPGVVNDGAMAMLEPRNTLAALTAHGSLIAPGGDKRGCRAYPQPSSWSRSSSMPK